MVEDKKQMISAVILGVFVLGAGSTYWFVSREPDSKAMRIEEQSVVKGKKTRASASDDKARTKKHHDRTNKTTAEIDRKRRDKSDGMRKKTFKKRGKKGRMKIEIKKEKHPPVAWVHPTEDRFEELAPQDYSPPMFG